MQFKVGDHVWYQLTEYPPKVGTRITAIKAKHGELFYVLETLDRNGEPWLVPVGSSWLVPFPKKENV